MFCQWERKPPKLPFPLGWHPPEEDRATVIGSMRKNGKDHARGLGDMLADRQTDTQTRSLQCFATAPVGEVIRFC